MIYFHLYLNFLFLILHSNQFHVLSENLEIEVTKIKQNYVQLRKEVEVLRQKVNLLSEYCRLQPDDVCGPCICRDDDRLSKKYYCDCQNLQPKRDCLEFKQYGLKISGVYKVHQNIIKIIQVYCDQETDNGGWTVIQRRNDGSVNFYRNWNEYKYGFGQLQNEFWLGNENIYTMSINGLYPRGSELRIKLINKDRVEKFAKYSRFYVGDEGSSYQLHVSEFSGTLNDGLKAHNMKLFSTYDVDNDDDPAGSCVRRHNAGGWWFAGCFKANLNGVFYPGGDMTYRTDNGQDIVTYSTGIHWVFLSFNDPTHSLVHTEMLMRRHL